MTSVYTTKCGTANCNDILSSFDLTINLPPELANYSPITITFSKTYGVWVGYGTSTYGDCPSINASVQMTCNNGIISFSYFNLNDSVYTLWGDLVFTSNGGSLEFKKKVIARDNKIATSINCCCGSNNCEVKIPSFGIDFIHDADEGVINGYTFVSYLFLYFNLGSSCAIIPPEE